MASDYSPTPEFSTRPSERHEDYDKTPTMIKGVAMQTKIVLGLTAASLLFGNAQLQTAKARSLSKPAAHVVEQQEDGWATIKTDEGMLFVWNVKDVHFTIAIKGKDIKPINDPDHIFFSVDGMVFQVQLAAIGEFAPDAKTKRLDDRAILAAHRDWEAKYLEDLLNTKLAVRNFNVRLSNGNDASLWQFDMPASANSEATKQVYLTSINRDYVLLLNIAVTKSISEEDSRKYLLDTMGTLRNSPDTINVQKLAASIRASTRP